MCCTLRFGFVDCTVNVITDETFRDLHFVQFVLAVDCMVTNVITNEMLHDGCIQSCMEMVFSDSCLAVV